MGQTVSSASWYMYAKANWTSPGFVRAAANFNASDLQVDLTGKVFLVTGANSGLGYELTRQLSERGAGEVIMLCRDLARGEAARQKLLEATGKNNITLEQLDVSRPPQIMQFAAKFNASGKRLDALINNAGALFHERQKTPEGFEETFACHVLGTYLLTESLMPSLLRTQPNARVITMSSGGLYTVKMDAEHFQSPKTVWSGTGFTSDGAAVYSQCKRQQLYLNEIWGRRYKDTTVKFHVTHPGWSRTEGTDKSLPESFKALPLRTPAEGVDTTLWLAIAQTGPPATTTGQFWFDRAPAVGEFASWLNNNASSPADIAKLEAYLKTCAESAVNAEELPKAATTLGSK